MAKTFTPKQQSRINALIKDPDRMKQTLNDPDLLAEWTNYFLGPDGPYPTPTLSELQQQKPAVHQIVAQLNHPDAGEFYKDCYAYSNEFTTGEPLIHPTTQAIIEALNSNDVRKDFTPPERIQLDFTINPDDLPVSGKQVLVELLFDLQDDEFSLDSVVVSAPESAAAEHSARALFNGTSVAHLCPHLLDHFPAPPKTFASRTTPL